MNVEWDASAQEAVITSPNVNIDVFNKLRDKILSKGEKSSVSPDYLIFYYPDSGEYSYMAAYDPEKNNLRLFFCDSGEEGDSVVITIYNNTSPSLLYKNVTSSGEEYKTLADFPHRDKQFVETASTFPDYLKPLYYINLNLDFRIMDLLTQKYVGVSFAELGLYYVSK